MLLAVLGVAVIPPKGSLNPAVAKGSEERLGSAALGDPLDTGCCCCDEIDIP